MANTDIELLASLNIDESEKAILNDIKAIQRRLEQSGVGKFKLTAELDNELLKSLREMTKSIEVKSFGKDMAKALIEQFNVVDKESQKLIKSLSNQLQNIRIGEIKTGTLNDNLLRVMNDLGEAVVNSANVIESRMGTFDKFYQFLKGIKTIKIPEVVQTELGDEWKSLRQLYPSKYSKTKGIELDTVYHEMSSQFPDILSPDVNNPVEQFKALSQAIKNYRQDVDKIVPLSESIELEDSVISNIYTGLAKLESALQLDNVKESMAAISGEASAMEKVEESAKTAALQKIKFADANEDVADSARRTTDAVEQEADAMMDMNNLDSILNGINMTANQSNNIFNQLGQQFRDTFSAYSVANLMERALDEVVDAGREALDVVKSFDDINVDLQMATGEDKEYVKQLLKDYSDLGDELSVLTQTVASSADSFLRQGRSMEDTNQLIRDSVVLSKVAQTSGENASEILTATLNGFQLSASEASHVSDVLTSIDLHSAASASGIGEALTKVASMANNAGLSLEKTAAILGTVKNNTQDLDKTIGTSLKTVLSRMSSIKAGKFIDEETGESLNDVEKVLGHISIETRDANGQFKDAEEILDAVGSKWNQLDRNTQNAVASAMAGTYQYNKLVSLFDNYSQALELTEIAQNSSGTAMEKFSNSYLPSLEAKTQALTSSLQNLANVTISDELYGQILDLTKGMVDATAESGILKNALLGISGAGTIYAFTQIGGLIRGATQELSNFSMALNIAHTGNIGQSELQQLIDLSGSLSQSQTRLLISQNSLTEAQRLAILVNQNLAQGMGRDLAESTARATLNTYGLANAQNTLTNSTVTLSGVLRGMIASLAANPYAVVTLGITAAATVYSRFRQSIEEARQASIKSATEAKELSDGIAELTNKYIELSDAVKTDSSVREQYLTIQDELIEKLGVEQSELQALTEQYGDLDTALKSISVDKLKAAQLDMLGGLDALRDDVIKEGKSNIWGTSNNITAKTNDDNAKAWDALEEAGIISQGQSGLYLDGDNSIDGILDNYNTLESALTALRESGKFTFDELSSNEVYQKIYDKWNGLKKPVFEYQSAIENLNNNQAQIVTLEALKGVAVPDTKEAYEDFRKDLIDSAVASEEFIGTQEEIQSVITNYLGKIPEFAKFTKVYEDLTNTANTAASALSNATQSDAVTKLDSLKEGFSKLQEIYNSISSEDGTGITAVVDEEITEIFAGATDELNEFIKTISESPNDIVACQSAFDNLIYAWLNSANILEVLNDDTVTLIGTFLEEQGVVNATSWLMDELVARKALAKAETEGLTISTAGEITALMDEATYSDDARVALARLVLAKETLNGTNIDVSGDIQNLIDLAVQANATQEVLASLKSYQKASQDFGQTVGDEITADDLAWERERATGAVKSTLKYNPSEGKGSATNSGSGYKPSSSKSSSSSSSSTKQDIIDWIETKITRCNEQIERLETKLAELPTRLQKNPHINTIIDEETEKLNILQQAYDEYMKSASESADKNGLKHEYVMKVQNGTIDIEQISDDSIKNAISEYQDLYNKALAANVEITATATKIKELKVQKLDNIANDYDNITSLIDSIYNYKEGLISLKEKAGEEILEEDYTKLISYQNSIYEANKREYEELLSEFNKLVDDGTISKYSDQWFDYTQQLHETNAELTESQEAIEDLRDSIIELRLKPLQDYKDSLDSINGSYETLLSLIGDEDLMNGSMITDRGLAQLAIYGQQLGMAKQEVEEYSNAIKSVSAMYENGTITVDEYNERIYDLRNAHESAISSVQKAREAILQFRYDAIQGQIEDMQELTQSRIDDLNQMKENEDYAKEISDKQKNISALEKKIAVLSLSTNRADMAMKLQLEQELADAREELAETQADHELDKTIEKLEDENKAYEKAKNEELKELKTNLNKQDEIIESYLGKVKDNYDSVYDTLNKYGEAYNLENTKDLTSPWENADSAMNSFVTSLADAVSKINISISNIETGKLNELSAMVGDLSNASSTSNNYKTAENNWKWQQGQGGKWWYGEDYREDGDYAYASGGIYNINGKQYKFDDEGYMITGWQQDNNDNWTYFETDDDNGQMVKSQWRQHSDGKWYYLTHDGTMAKDAIVENRDGNGYYYVDKNGVWDESLGVNGLLPEEEALKLSKYRAYKKGTKRVEAEQFAWTQDGGREVIARKDGGILTKLYPGDGVIPHNMAENLFAWSEYNPLDVFKKSYAHISQPSMSGNGVVIGDIHNEFNITGDADSVLKVVKKYATGPMWDDIKNKTKMYGR